MRYIIQSSFLKREEIIKQTCLRCGYKWFPKNLKLPKTCPNRKCRSPYWMKPRQVEGSNNVQNG